MENALLRMPMFLFRILPRCLSRCRLETFSDTSKIEVFDGKNFKRWQERVYSVLDMHGVATALDEPLPTPESDQAAKDAWTYANKVCRHTLISTLSNDLFDVYCVYKEAQKIWESLIRNTLVEDAWKTKVRSRKFLQREMIADKDVKLQINEYHKLLEELRAENINLLDEFVAGILIEKRERHGIITSEAKHKRNNCRRRI
ncbi:hypothetical protein K1719_042909 [Acacia pycnantha]|nr:hypothetical protein K1719_042909 [Acacia pycnantha]